MKSPWPVRVLLPAAQVLAEGAWLAVLYAALQALTGEMSYLGPVELGVMAWAGMAWGRRRRWTSTRAEALGLPLLALLAGIFGWLVDPDVRMSLTQGNLLLALGLHGPGWLGAVAFWRGEVHRSRDDDDAIQDRLLRWAVPGLAVPWLLGHMAASGRLEDDFTAAAFVGTIFFIGSAFTAMGLARLEAVRSSTGSDWRGNRSWLLLVLGMALALTAITVPAAAFLGIPARSLMIALLGPVQTIIFLLVLLAMPIFLAAALVADLVHPLLPEGFGLGNIRIPGLSLNTPEATSSLPAILFYVIVGTLLVFELFVLGFMIWLRYQERKRMRDMAETPFEERSIVVPAATARRPDRAARAQRHGGPVSGNDPTAAYLAALASLERDGRWARRGQETPAAHVARARSEGLRTPSLARLALAYQLVRYGGRPLADREIGRARHRLRTLRSWLRRA